MTHQRRRAVLGLCLGALVLRGLAPQSFVGSSPRPQARSEGRGLVVGRESFQNPLAGPDGKIDQKKAGSRQ